MNTWHCDFETFSRADIRKYGAYRYASDESTQILLCAIARNDEPPLMWDCNDPDGADNRESCGALLLLQEAVDSGSLIYAHNAPFEIAISRYLWEDTFGFDPPQLDQWRCTAAMGRRAALPHSLADLGAILNISEQKDKRGEQLIKIFCCPRTAGKLKGQRIMPDDEGTVTLLGDKIPVSEAWNLFREYCRRDVVAERLIHQKLSTFELKGTTLKSFQFDLRMNARGLPVNVPALHLAKGIVDDASKEDIKRSIKICGFAPTQVTRLLPWLQERGYHGGDLREETTDFALTNCNGMTPEAREVLEIRSRVAFSAVKKIPTMINAACPDGRVRGTFMWSGAIRTHRWSGKIIQPQNFKRPTIKNTHDAYRHILAKWDHEMLGLIYGSPVEVVASCIRHFIDSGNEILDADYSNIEARIVPWLAGQESLLNAFRMGVDPYVMMAAKVFSRNELEVTKDERFVGKQLILGAGYQLGWEKFKAMCLKYGRDLDDELCKTAVSVYREENPDIVTLWKSMNRAAIQAIENPGHQFCVRGKITFGMAKTTPFPALMMRLPSGHHLVYPWPQLAQVWIFQKKKYPSEAAANYAYQKAKKNGELEEGDRVWATQQISFMGVNPLNKQWVRLTTYGGSLTENCWAGDTEVLTEKGWKRIDSITDEKVFDGVEFVQHNGLKIISEATTIQLDTLRVTPDHLVLTPHGWVQAQDVKINEAYSHFQTCFRTPGVADKGHNGSKTWAFNSIMPNAPGWNWLCEVDVPMRLWWDQSYRDFGTYTKKRYKKVRDEVWVCGERKDSRHVLSPCFLGMEKYARQVQTPYSPSMAQLWGKRDKSVQTMGQVHSFLGGHGAFLPKWAYTGEGGQQQRLQPEELSMGYLESSGKKHKTQHFYRHSLGKNDSEGGFRKIRGGMDNNPLQTKSGSEGERPSNETRRKEPVYDLINCGPRHQYVVRGSNKKPIIAHNCSQAIAGDFITHGAMQAEKKNYEIFMLVHDQALSEYHPERGNTVDGFREALCSLPPWAPDFPLAAECNVQPFYSKD